MGAQAVLQVSLDQDQGDDANATQEVRGVVLVKKLLNIHVIDLYRFGNF